MTIQLVLEIVCTVIKLSAPKTQTVPHQLATRVLVQLVIIRELIACAMDRFAQLIINV